MTTNAPINIPAGNLNATRSFTYHFFFLNNQDDTKGLNTNIITNLFDTTVN